MYRLVFGLYLILFVSCARTIDLSSDAKFYKKGVDFEYVLQLTGDGTFIFEEKYKPHSYSKCKGIWRQVNGSIVLLCDEQDTSEKLLSSYMSKRKRELMIINNNKLKFNSVILKRE